MFTVIIISLIAIKTLLFIIVIGRIIRAMNQIEYMRDHAETSKRDGNYRFNCHYSGIH